jgi:hypothetical protein
MRLIRNLDGQILYFGLTNGNGTPVVLGDLSEIGAFTAKDGGSQQPCSGQLVSDGQGQYHYTPTAAETDGDFVGFWFTAPTAGASGVSFSFATR